MRYYITFVAFIGLSNIAYAQNAPNYFPTTISPSIDYFSLDGSIIKKATTTANITTVIVLTKNSSINALPYHISKRHLITIPNAEIMKKLDSCSEYTDNTSEYGFLIGRLGMASPIEIGENRKFNASKRSKCLAYIKSIGDTGAYDVHTHPKSLVPKKNGTFDYGIVIASDSDMISYKTTLYIQPSMVLGYYGQHVSELTRHVCFYNEKENAIAIIDFEEFKNLIDDINLKRRDKSLIKTAP